MLSNHKTRFYNVPGMSVYMALCVKCMRIIIIPIVADCCLEPHYYTWFLRMFTMPCSTLQGPFHASLHGARSFSLDIGCE